MLYCEVERTFLVFSQLVWIHPQLHQFVEKGISIWVLAVIDKEVVQQIHAVFRVYNF